MFETGKNGAISRRGFLGLSAVAGATSLTCLAGCSPKGKSQTGDTKATGSYPENDICGRISMSELEGSSIVADPITTFDSEQTYDVIVIGAGASGIPAAIAAAESGAKVCVLQKEKTAASQGASCCYIDTEATDELAMAHLMHTMRDIGAYRANWNLNKVWVDNSTEAVSWFMDHLKDGGYEEKKDYLHIPIKKYSYPEGDAKINCYIFPNNVGGAVSALADKYASLFDIEYETPGVQLVVENNKVVGVFAKDPSGKIIKLHANKGVILATGDYQNNDAMVEKYVPDAAPFARKQMNKTGDGQLMGMLAGGAMERIGHTKMIHSSNAAGNSKLMQSGTMLAVNKEGERFCAEDCIMSVRNNIARNQTDGTWISILDSKDPLLHETLEEKDQVVSDLSKLDAAVADGGVFKADSLEELAKAVDVPGDALKKTIERYNELCAGTGDLDFGKATSCMISVDTPPYYAIHRQYAIAALTSGLVIDENANVLGEDSKPIEGLYAVGNCSGPFFGVADYPMDIPGLSVSRAVTFGYCAGKKVASL